MKIIFSKDFVDSLIQSSQIKFTNYSIISGKKGEFKVDSDVLLTVGNKKELSSIWDEDSKILRTSIENIDVDEEEELKYLQIIYTIPGDKTIGDTDNDKVAFILVGDNCTYDENSKTFTLKELGLSIVKNIININLSDIITTSTSTIININVDTVLTDNNIKILESPIDLGNNVYLVEPDNIVTITKKSFIKRLYSEKCKDTLDKLLPQDYISSDTGEHVYRNTKIRIYNPDKFFPKLVGDVINTSDKNQYGLKYEGGRIKVAGIVEYTDYYIQNSRIVDSEEGYQSIESIQNILVKASSLINESTNKIYSPISLSIVGKILTFGSININDIKGSSIDVSLSNIKLNEVFSDNIRIVTDCSKQLGLIQSNRFDVPWKLNLQKEYKYNYEYELVDDGLLEHKIPVLMFNESGRTIPIDNNENIRVYDYYTITLTTDNDFVIDAIKNNNFGIRYEHSSEFIPPIEVDAKTQFEVFFEVSPFKKSGIQKGNYQIKVKCKDDPLSLSVLPKNMWAPLTSSADGDIQLFIKCVLYLESEDESLLNGRKKFETPFYVIRKKDVNTVLSIYDLNSKKDLTTLNLKKTDLGDNTYYYKTDPFNLEVLNFITPEQESNGIWIIDSNSLPTGLMCSYYNSGVNNYYGIIKDNESESLTLTTSNNPSERLQNLNKITFYYIDGVENVPDKLNFEDWKSTMYCPKYTLDIIQEKNDFITIAKESVVFKDNLTNPTESYWLSEKSFKKFNTYVSDDRILDSRFLHSIDLGRLGKFPIIIKLDDNIESKEVFVFGDNNFDFYNIENKEDFKLKLVDSEGNEITSSGKKIKLSEGKNVTLYIEFTNYWTLTNEQFIDLIYMFWIKICPASSSLDKQVTFKYGYFINISINSCLNYGFLTSGFISKNQGYYMETPNNIIYITELSNNFEYKNGEIQFEFTSPLFPEIIGLPDKIEGSTGETDLILGTTYDENNGCIWGNYLKSFNLGYFDNNQDLPIIFKTPDPEFIEKDIKIKLETGEDTTYKGQVCKYSVGIPCSYKTLENEKFPTSSLGKITIYHKGVSSNYYNENKVKFIEEGKVGSTLTYDVRNSGIVPKLYYSDNTIINNISEINKLTELNTDSINIYVSESNLGNDITLSIKSIYPLIINETILFELMNNGELINEEFSLTSKLNWVNYKNIVADDNTFTIKLNEGDFPTDSKSTLRLKHYLPEQINNTEIGLVNYQSEYLLNIIYKINDWCEIIAPEYIHIKDKLKLFYLDRVYGIQIPTITSNLGLISNIINDSLRTSFTLNLESITDDSSIDNFLNKYKDGTTIIEDGGKLKVENEEFYSEYNEIKLDDIELEAKISDDFISKKTIKRIIPGLVYKNELGDDIRLFITNPSDKVVNEIPSYVERVSFSVLGLDDINSELLKTDLNNVTNCTVEIESVTTVDIDSGKITNTAIKEKITYLDEEGNLNNNILVTLPENLDKKAKKIVNIKVSYGYISFIYQIIQENKGNLPLIIEKNNRNFTFLEEDSSTIDPKLVKTEGSYTSGIAYHSSGNLLCIIDDEQSFSDIKDNMNEVIMKFPKDIQIESIQCHYIDYGGDSLIKIVDYPFIHQSKEDNYNKYSVNLKISPNYLKYDKFGYILIRSKDKIHSWKIDIMQGFITPVLNFNRDNSTYLLDIVDQQILGYVGSKTEPIEYPDSVVKTDPYFYVQIIQKEFLLSQDDHQIIPGEEVTINHSYTKYIDKIDQNTPPSSTPGVPGGSIKLSSYAVVTYQADQWSSSTTDLNYILKPGFDTDLYYSDSKSSSDLVKDYPRLVHKYNVIEEYKDDYFEFNTIVRFSIDNYKKFLYKLNDQTNVISSILSLETTPFVYLFYIKKKENKSILPFTVYKYNELGELVEADSIHFSNDVTDTEKQLVVKFNIPGMYLKDLDVISDSDWIKLSINNANNTVLVTRKIDGNGFNSNYSGLITFKPKSTTMWSGIVSVIVNQDQLDTYLLYKDPYVYSGPSSYSLVLEQVFRKEIDIDTEIEKYNWEVEYKYLKPENTNMDPEYNSTKYTDWVRAYTEEDLYVNKRIPDVYYIQGGLLERIPGDSNVDLVTENTELDPEETTSTVPQKSARRYIITDAPLNTDSNSDDFIMINKPEIGIGGNSSGNGGDVSTGDSTINTIFIGGYSETKTEVFYKSDIYNLTGNPDIDDNYKIYRWLLLVNSNHNSEGRIPTFFRQVDIKLKLTYKFVGEEQEKTWEHIFRLSQMGSRYNYIPGDEFIPNPGDDYFDEDIILPDDGNDDNGSEGIGGTTGDNDNTGGGSTGTGDGNEEDFENNNGDILDKDPENPINPDAGFEEVIP